MSDFNVPFIGILNIPLKTLSTTYTPVNGGFSFDLKNVQPIDMKGWLAAISPFNFVAMQANVISRNFITQVTIGTPSGAPAATGSTSISWTPDGKIIGFGTIANGTGQMEPWGVEAAMPLNGTPVVLGGLATDLQVLPNASNTVSPASFYSWGGNVTMNAGGYGAMYSYVISLVDHYARWDGVHNENSGIANPGLFNNLTSWHGTLPGNLGVDTVYMDNELGSPPQIFQVYDMIQLRPNSGHWTVSLQNPATFSIDINANWWNANLTVYQICKFGLISIFKGSQTFNGVNNAQGWGVLVRNDMAGWYLLNIVGTDGTSIPWGGSSGSVFGAIDWAGDLHMKQANTNGLLLISVNSITSLQPQTQGIVSGLGIIGVPHSEGLF
jgi:hypothetical protein